MHTILKVFLSLIKLTVKSTDFNQADSIMELQSNCKRSFKIEAV